MKNIINNWLDKNGTKEIEKQVEMEAEQYSKLLSEFETMEGITSNMFDEIDWARFDRFVESRTQQIVEEKTELYIKEDEDFKTEGFSEYQNGKFNGFIDGYNSAIRDKTEEKYTKEDLFKATLEAVNLGMRLRQDQLNGRSDKLGNEVHKEWFNSYEI